VIYLLCLKRLATDPTPILMPSANFRTEAGIGSVACSSVRCCISVIFAMDTAGHEAGGETGDEA